MKKLINAQEGKATFNLKGKDLSIDLAGIDSKTICYLALHGAHEILIKRADPVKSWQDIRNGQIHKERKQPAIITAIAQVYDMSTEDASKFWSRLSAANKRALRQDTRIKVVLLTHSDQVEVDISGFSGKDT